MPKPLLPRLWRRRARSVSTSDALTAAWLSPRDDPTTFSSNPLDPRILVEGPSLPRGGLPSVPHLLVCYGPFGATSFSRSLKSLGFFDALLLIGCTTSNPL